MSRWLRLRRDQHVHRCACGNAYVCASNPDQCPKHWQCDSCVTEQMDEFFREPTHTEQETTHDEHQLSLP